MSLRSILASEGLASSFTTGSPERKAILAGLSILAAELRDPKTGLSVAELRAKIDALGWSEANRSQRDDLSRIHDRLVLRQKKMERGLRLSSRPKDVAGIIGQKGQWGYGGKWTTWSDYNGVPYAVLQGDAVVAWVVKVDRTFTDTQGKSYGGNIVNVSNYNAYDLEGKKIGMGGNKSPNNALDEVAAHLKRQAS